MRKKEIIKQRHLLTAFALAVSCTISGVAIADNSGALPELKVDKAKAELGKRLFFDKRLSGDAAFSCATCHAPANGFSFPGKLSLGYPGNGHFRNSIGLINVAHKKVWLHDGRIGTNLNDVTREMITEDYIMNMDMRIMQERVKQDPIYIKMFKDAGYGEPSNGKIRKAIPEYLKTLVSKGAPFDTGKLSAEAKAGQKVFNEKGCNSCHSGAMFTDGKPHNTGVPENVDVFLNPMNHQAFLAYAMFQGINGYMDLKRDPGAYTQWKKGDRSNMGAFITPSLRELTQTAPYMHNGMLATLEDVVDFYNAGGGKDSKKDPMMKPLNLSDKDKANLIAFLKSLSGEKLTSAEYVWKDPYPTEYAPIADWNNTPN